MAGWWETFFDADYLQLWEGAELEGRTEHEVEGLWTVLGLSENSNVLDAPCGHGRISRGLAARGARVVGVFLSPTQRPSALRAVRVRQQLVRDDCQTRCSASNQQALQPPNLPYMSVEVNVIHVERLFHTQWTCNGMFKNRSAEAFAVKAAYVCS
jgi:hypothetical protein